MSRATLATLIEKGRNIRTGAFLQSIRCDTNNQDPIMVSCNTQAWPEGFNL